MMEKNSGTLFRAGVAYAAGAEALALLLIFFLHAAANIV